jgi:hypothetical protein
MIEDIELDRWREQWSGVAEGLPELRQIQRKIKRQNLRFVLDNLLAAVAFVGGLIFAVFVSQKRGLLGTGWAAGICAFLFVSMGLRLWAQRGTWRAETQSSRAFVELWQRRVIARIRSLRMAIYAAPGWIAFCALLTVANWKTIGPHFKAHPAEWLAPLAVNFSLLPVIFLCVAWYRRQKLAELNEVNKILDEMRE